MAIPLLLIPRLYVGQEYEKFARVDGEHIENDYWKFFIGTLPQAIVKMSWLWFLLGLFLNCMVLYPLLAWTQRRQAKIKFTSDDGLLVLGQLAVIGVIGYLGSVLAGKDALAQYLPSIGIVLAYFTA